MQRPIVLLAEPDDDSRAMYADYLAVRGFEVIVVTTSDDALLEAPHVDVIVTGARLAGTVDGIELVRRLRGNDQSGRRPIIVLTACAFEADQQLAMSAGCDTFLTKPCVPDRLETEIRRLLGARGRGRKTLARAHLEAKRPTPKAS